MFAALSSYDLHVFLLHLAILLGVALLFAKLASRIGFPAVVGELCAGIVLGPSLLGPFMLGLNGSPRAPATQSHLIDAVGQVGVLILVGLSGAQMDFGLIRRETRTVLRVSAFGLIIPLGLGAATGLLFPASLIGSAGDRGIFTLFLSVALAVSAVPVIAKTLQDMRLLHRNIGQLTLAASVLDDAAGWFLLSVVSAFVTVRAGHRAGHLALALASLVGVMVAAALVGRPIARLILRLLNRSGESAVHVALVVALILLAASGTGALGIEPVFGAFVCGMTLSATGCLDQVKLAPLNTVVIGFLAPVFFATAGLRMDLGALRSFPVLAAAVGMLLAAVVGKFVGAYVGAWLSRLSHWEAIVLGAGLNSRGVIQIVIATVGLQLNVLTTASYTIIVLVAVTTSAAAAPAIRAATRRITVTEEEDLRAKSLIAVM